MPNGCDHTIELVVDDSDISLDDLETLGLGVVRYEPGQTETTSVVTGIDEARLITGVSRKEPTVLAVAEVSPSEPARSYAVSGDPCEVARP